MSAGDHMTLSCERCGGPLAFQSPFCHYCRVPLTWGALVDITPGRSVVTLDLRTQPVPRESSFGTDMMVAPNGRLLTLDGSVSFFGSMTTAGMRNACVAMTAICYEPNLGVGVTARVHRMGHATGAYAVMINPSARAYRVHRMLWTKKDHFFDVIRDWEVTPVLGGLGAPNRVELRYADAVFHVLLNGVHVASIVDARFGFGHVGWRTTSYDDFPQRKRVVLCAMEVRTVARR